MDGCGGSDNFAALNFEDPRPAASAKRWSAGVGQLFQFQSGGHGRVMDFVVRMGQSCSGAQPEI